VCEHIAYGVWLSFDPEFVLELAVSLRGEGLRFAGVGDDAVVVGCGDWTVTGLDVQFSGEEIWGA